MIYTLRAGIIHFSAQRPLQASAKKRWNLDSTLSGTSIEEMIVVHVLVDALSARLCYR